MKILIISLKNSKRVKFLKKRLKDIKINFNVLNGINGNLLKKNKKLKLICNFKNIKKNIGRTMSPSEIGAAASHLKAYKYIIKNNISNAIIMEDDAYPSNLLKKWVLSSKTKFAGYGIVSFYAYPSGFLFKRPESTPLKNIFIYKSASHLFNNSCYQINKMTCEKILSLTKGLVNGYPDWPFNVKKDKIPLYVTIPYLTIINDRGSSNLKNDRDKILEKQSPKIKKIIPKFLIPFFSFLYYFFFIPYLNGNYANFRNYYEHHFEKRYILLKNFFFSNYIDQKKNFYLKKNYPKDLRNFIDKI